MKLTIQEAVAKARECNKAIIRANRMMGRDFAGWGAIMTEGEIESMERLRQSAVDYRHLMMGEARLRKEHLRCSRQALMDACATAEANWRFSGFDSELDRLREARYQLSEFMTRHGKEMNL